LPLKVARDQILSTAGGYMVASSTLLTWQMCSTQLCYITSSPHTFSIQCSV